MPHNGFNGKRQRAARQKFQAPTSRLQRISSSRLPNRHQIRSMLEPLELLWMLALGAWMFFRVFRVFRG
jgi:hypothetical protein